MVRWMKNKKQIKTTMKRTMLLVCMRESTNRTAERCGGLRRKKEKKEKIDRERRKKEKKMFRSLYNDGSLFSSLAPFYIG
jgi:hypothetical protein